nr:immunoglobulin heavy chain junction region [Macaca mulatta]MOY23416.1 immunoglobulin heavy chain junction region [Macaca mulatta]MOY23874.1 immunoglobulin heavy chain junction region [Macaca mulatta]MOY26152.1 immunoglobulin heavy chain junction region [Macaca mulatta]MOY26817.1 immunoglobulin heavy chain junction region [Macaca mulatta]
CVRTGVIYSWSLDSW